jgi:hypothetical protein
MHTVTRLRRAGQLDRRVLYSIPYADGARPPHRAGNRVLTISMMMVTMFGVEGIAEFLQADGSRCLDQNNPRS